MNIHDVHLRNSGQLHLSSLSSDATGLTESRSLITGAKGPYRLTGATALRGGRFVAYPELRAALDALSGWAR